MASRENTASDAAYWYVPLSRAVVAAMVAIIITFNADHSPSLGLFAFGLFGVLTGLVVVLASLRALEPGVERSVFIGQGVLTFAAGAVALLWPHAGLGFFLFLVSGWAALTGFLEIYAGVRSRGRRASSRDWVFIGALTVLFAIVVLIVPPDLNDHFVGANKVSGVLSSSIVVVGLLGAYAAVAAVYLVIAGLSLKWAPTVHIQDGTAS